MSPDPVVTCIERDEQDNYLLVACDGIYDFLSNQEIIEYINERFTSEENEKEIVSNLIDLALHKVSRWNIFKTFKPNFRTRETTCPLW